MGTMEIDLSAPENQIDVPGDYGVGDDEIPQAQDPGIRSYPNRVDSLDKLTDEQRYRHDTAQQLAARGFRILELTVGSKVPVGGRAWGTFATREPAKITEWFLAEPDMNYGVCPSDRHVIVDLDNKPGVAGRAAFLDLLEEDDIDLPHTLWAKTCHDGYHVYLRVEEEKGNANSFPAGIDVRGGRGYVVGPGCYAEPDEGRDGDGWYEIESGTIEDIGDCPEALLPYLKKPAHRDPDADDPLCHLNMPSSIRQAEDFIEKQKPARQGYNGNDHTYNLACFMRDFGLSADMAVAVMLESEWNTKRCEPAWGFDELQTLVYNAWSYARNRPGCRIVQVQNGRPVKVPDEEPIEPVDYVDWRAGGFAETPQAETEAAVADDIPDDGAPPLLVLDDGDRPLSGAEIAGADFPRARHIWDGFLLDGLPNVLDGDGGIGKTQALIQIGVAVAAGKPLFGRAVIQKPVLLLLCEDEMGEVKHRLHQSCGYLGVKLEDIPLQVWCRVGETNTIATIQDNGEWSPGPFYPHLEEWIENVGQPCFVGLDNISDIAHMDENKRPPMHTLGKVVLSGLSKRHGSTFLVLRHPSKASMNDGSYYAGSTAAQAAFRSRLVLKQHEKGTGLNLSVGKANYGKKGDNVDLHNHGGLLRHTGDLEEKQRIEAEREGVFEALKRLRESGTYIVPTQGNGMKLKELVPVLAEDGFHLSAKEITNYVRQLEMAQRIHYRGRSGGKNYCPASYEIGPAPVESEEGQNHE